MENFEKVDGKRFAYINSDKAYVLKFLESHPKSAPIVRAEYPVREDKEVTTPDHVLKIAKYALVFIADGKTIWDLQPEDGHKEHEMQLRNAFNPAEYKEAKTMEVYFDSCVYKVVGNVVTCYSDVCTSIRLPIVPRVHPSYWSLLTERHGVQTYHYDAIGMFAKLGIPISKNFRYGAPDFNYPGFEQEKKAYEEFNANPALLDGCDRVILESPTSRVSYVLCDYRWHVDTQL
jgi:hypothetical protein